MATTNFHRYHPTAGRALYWILPIYLVLGYFYPVVGLLALICMIAPVAFAVRRGRWWCGNACPRGISTTACWLNIRLTVRSRRLSAHSDSACSWCCSSSPCSVYRCTSPGATGMRWGGSSGRSFSLRPSSGLSSPSSMPREPGVVFARWVRCRRGCRPKVLPLPGGFVNIHVADTCRMKCRSCARVCPMQLTPYDCRGEQTGYLHADCIKCGKCVTACPVRIMELRHDK